MGRVFWNNQINWPEVLGQLFFTGMMAVGYFYNVTFIQLGPTDVGTRIIRMSKQQVAEGMTTLALLALLVALTFGYWMQKTGRGANFYLKHRLVFLVVLVQTLLTAAATYIRTGTAFSIWIFLAAVAMCIGMPALSASQPLPGNQQTGRLVTIAIELPFLTGLAFLSARFLPGLLVNVGHTGTWYPVPSAAIGLLAGWWAVTTSLDVLSLSAHPLNSCRFLRHDRGAFVWRGALCDRTRSLDQSAVQLEIDFAHPDKPENGRDCLAG